MRLSYKLFLLLLVLLTGHLSSCKEKKDAGKVSESGANSFTYQWDGKPPVAPFGIQFNKQKRKVFNWIVKCPPLNPYRHWKGEPVPYENYDLWYKAGKEIDGLEETLLEFYREGIPLDFSHIILKALGFFGTSLSVPLLTEIIEDESEEGNAKVRTAISLLGGIGDPAAIPVLSGILEIDPSEVSEKMRMTHLIERSNAIFALGNIGDPNVIPLIEAELNIPNELLPRERIMDVLEKLKRRSEGPRSLRVALGDLGKLGGE